MDIKMEETVSEDEIKKKTVVSEQLNFTSERSLAVIEYPGMVVNVDKMLNTLGGIETISQVVNGEQKQFELRYHPENPFNKAAFSSCQPNVGVLLKVKIRRSKRQPSRILKEEVTILGRCCKLYTFENLCDFQYLPLIPQSTQNNGISNYVNALEDTRPKHVTEIEYFSRTDAPILSLPIHFARSDIVPASIFRSDEHEDGQNESLGIMQRTAYDTRDIVKFTIDEPLPQEPDPMIVKKMRVKYISDEQYDKVRKLFEKCPIWPRCALVYESGISHDKLKCISPSLAFYYSTGPWRSMFVRYGFDPRKDFQSRFYQTFDFRLRYRSAMFNWVSCRRDLIQKNREEGADAPCDEDSIEILQDVNYPYLEEHKLPRTRQCLVRYCDVHLPVVQDMMEKIVPPLNGGICDERTGWLPAGFDDQVRAIVLNCVKTVLRNYFRKEEVPAEFDADSVENEEIEDADLDADVSDASNASESELPDEFQEILDNTENED